MSTLLVILLLAVLLAAIALGVSILRRKEKEEQKKKEETPVGTITLIATAEEPDNAPDLFDRQPHWNPEPVMREEQLQGNGGWATLDALASAPGALKTGIHTRGYVSTWRKIGALQSVSPLDPTILALYARPADGRLQYMVTDENGAIIELYGRNDVRVYDYSRAFARNGNILPAGAIPSKEAGGAFRVLLFDEHDRQRYKQLSAV